MSSEKRSQRTYKFMTNIITESKYRTRYIKSLEKVTMDANVTYQRLIVAMGVGVMIIAAVIYFTIGGGPRAKYTSVPIIFLGLSLLTLLVAYMLPARGLSMLQAVQQMMVGRANEKLRIASKKQGNLRDVGIEQVKDGIIYFSDGDIGVAYDVEGQLSLSVLPAVAEKTASVRSQYFVARNETSQETLIISVKEVDVSAQLANLDYYDSLSKEKNLEDAWNRHMINLTREHITNNLARREYTLSQTLIIRDIDIEALNRSQETFAASVSNGLYSYARRISTAKELAERLGPLTLMSQKGIEKHGQEK